MSRPIFSSLVILATLVALPAQQPLTAKSFLPADYDSVASADMKRLRDTGIWEELEHSLLGVAFRQMEKESGFTMDALDRITVVLTHPAAEDRAAGSNFRPLYLFEGNASLGWPPTINGNDRYQKEKIGGFDCFTTDMGPYSEVMVRPTPSLRIVGHPDLVTPVLNGKPSHGMAKPDLMSLLSGRGDNLAYIVAAIGTKELRHDIQINLIQQTDWPEDDQPTYLMMRVLATGDADDPHLQIEAVIRHQRGKQGLEISDKAVRALIASQRKEAKVPAMQAVWDKVAVEHSGIDLVARIDLGRARNAIGTLAQLVAPMFVQGATVSEEIVEEPPPPPPPQQPKGKGND